MVKNVSIIAVILAVFGFFGFVMCESAAAGPGYVAPTTPPAQQYSISQQMSYDGLKMYADAWNDLDTNQAGMSSGFNLYQGFGGRYYQFISAQSPTLYSYDDGHFGFSGIARFYILPADQFIPNYQLGMKSYQEMPPLFDDHRVSSSVSVQNQWNWWYDESTGIGYSYPTADIEVNLNLQAWPARIESISLRPNSYTDWEGRRILELSVDGYGLFVPSEKIFFNTSSPVTPEPATMLILALGGGCVLAKGRRRQN